MVLSFVNKKKCATAIFTGVLFCIGPNSAAQKLKTERFDAATKQWLMESFPVNVKLSADVKTNFTLVATDTTVRLFLSGSGIGTSTVDLGSELIFVLDNDSTVAAKSVAVQGINFENLTSTYRHQYELSIGALRALSRHQVKAIRKHFIGGVNVIPVDAKNSWKVSDVSRVLVSKLKEKKLLPEKTVILPAAFPGGHESLKRFLARNFSRLSEFQNGEKKSTVASFSIGSDGMVNDIQLNTSTGTPLDVELIRIFKRMPKWKPALQNGKPIPYQVRQSITLQRQNDSLQVDLL